MAIAKVKIRGI